MKVQTIISRENSKILHASKLLRDKEYRRAQGEFVIEGLKIIKEALLSGAQLSMVFADEQTMALQNVLVNELYNAGAEILCVTGDLISRISDVKTPQGIAAVCAMNKKGASPFMGERVIVLEDIRDPGNLGTVIRTADAFSIDSVALLSQTVDLYNPKVLRATMGSVFRVNVFLTSVRDLCSYCDGQKIPLYGAALSSDCQSIDKIDLSKAAVIIGNESCGISDGMKLHCDKMLKIPMQGNAESLNAAVAASIIMWEMSGKSGF